MAQRKKSTYQRNPYARVALAYAEDILDGKIIAGHWVQRAAQRFLDDIAAQGTQGFPYRWNIEAGSKVCQFVELCKHVKGDLGGLNIKLSNWQTFVLMNVFGWLHDRGTLEGKRRFRKSYIEVARKNGKSTLAAPLCLYMLACDGEAGAEVYTAATTRDQARIIFGVSKMMAQKDPGMCKSLGIQINAHNLTHLRSGSVYKPLSSEADSLDGLHIHGVFIDELHAHPTRSLFDVLLTGMGARSQPLLFTITTAGSNLAGICYEERTYITKLLNRVSRDESYFGMIYSTDEDDVWNDESTWVKANPNLGISASVENMRDLATKAIVMPSQQATFKTKYLDIWLNSDAPYFDMLAWQRCGDKTLRLEDFRGADCTIGLDLATRIDLAAKVLLFRKLIGGETHYYIFGTYYLPETAIEDNRNASYYGWVVDGLIKPTPGSITDFHIIKDDILEDCRNYHVEHVPFDPFQSAYLETELLNEGVPVIEYRNTVANLSFAMKELQGLIYQGRIHHDGNNCLTWQMSNVVAHIDAKDNVFPRKERPENKIDGPVAIIFALGVSMSVEPASDVWAQFISY